MVTPLPPRAGFDPRDAPLLRRRGGRDQHVEHLREPGTERLRLQSQRLGLLDILDYFRRCLNFG